MKRATISQGGQIQVPAEIRRRWETREVLIEDRGNSVVLRPLPDDPISAALGSLAPPGVTGDEIRRRTREEDAEREARDARDAHNPGTARDTRDTRDARDAHNPGTARDARDAGTAGDTPVERDAAS